MLNDLEVDKWLYRGDSCLHCSIGVAENIRKTQIDGWLVRVFSAAL
jgi:hypothetical protein